MASFTDFRFVMSRVAMSYPKVQSVEVIDDHTLLVKFDNTQTKKYDVTPLLEKEMFAPLRNPALFKSVQVEQGGYAVAWNSDIDISEYELWSNDQTVS
ncbi:MAG: DUF2442 domain-containing protein [Nitrospira sp.]|nr:DUF2442 domain-containing protein [Nitrospira sp.]MDE0405000.1 DUF2442 domain-containing protein [Nitrospira sp.]MDE0486864.1 DUF2442 domain-containing protein [Nitrospira sp.]